MSSEDKEPLSGHCLVHLRCELLLCLRPIVEGRDVDVEEISVWLRFSGILCEPGETYQVGLCRRGDRRKMDETVRSRDGLDLVLEQGPSDGHDVWARRSRRDGGNSCVKGCEGGVHRTYLVSHRCLYTVDGVDSEET